MVTKWLLPLVCHVHVSREEEVGGFSSNGSLKQRENTLPHQHLPSQPEQGHVYPIAVMIHRGQGHLSYLTLWTSSCHVIKEEFY